MGKTVVIKEDRTGIEILFTGEIVRIDQKSSISNKVDSVVLSKDELQKILAELA